eukprot:scaffold12213_cov115-Isochrysis_galbana.AAC.11
MYKQSGAGPPGGAAAQLAQHSGSGGYIVRSAGQQSQRPSKPGHPHRRRPQRSKHLVQEGDHSAHHTGAEDRTGKGEGHGCECTQCSAQFD